MRIKCKLKVILAELDMDHGDLAKKAMVSSSNISLLVNNKSLPSLPVAYRIGQALNLPIEEIWIDLDTKKPPDN
ncbi:helix-turn-helix transcriptional regulator [Marininema halotolerans]|uniref:Putative transcriptional regulator n=1 Tax=Marininema halotolerans TaxID=1155944 RepID=A0A1I6URD6_9BACL|nr:helix-turn-helix domain-containing protein [Marininema halotolerans]SFT03970.1 putative transcriptional regulator [Marininema halotolerans]